MTSELEILRANINACGQRIQKLAYEHLPNTLGPCLLNLRT